MNKKLAPLRMKNESPKHFSQNHENEWTKNRFSKILRHDHNKNLDEIKNIARQVLT